MLHPVGSLPPHVYWRRRIMLGGLIAAIVLLVLTVYVVTGTGTAPEDAASNSGLPSPSHSPTAPAHTGSSSASGASSSAAGTGSAGASSGVSTSPNGSSTGSPTGAATPPCTAAQLAISATSSAPSYPVGSQPVLTLQVTDNGPGNCTQDLADSQVELRVYNGAARVWGSHDCLVQPGTSVKTLMAGTTVGVQITWSGLSSQPGCAGTRQRVGAGTYTLYPFLAGNQGSAAQFSIA